MPKKTVNTIKLGVFVLAGLLFLILLLYMIGKNRNLFGPAFVLKARFENAQGLVPGNNVRYAGIAIGTVKRIHIVGDTIIEVVMVVDKDMKQVIHKNAMVTIGSDGLMGNKVINIAPVHEQAALVSEGDILPTRKVVSIDDMIQSLGKTGSEVAVIAENLKTTVQRLNSSTALWTLLNDESLPANLRASVMNVKLATGRAAAMANDLQVIVQNVKNGKGSVGAVLNDTSFAANLGEAIEKIKEAGNRADELAGALNAVIKDVHYDMNNGKGALNALLKDSAIVLKLNNSLDNIQKGTNGFNQNMEALKHNFFFRGYFRKQEKQKVNLKRETANVKQ